jgi:predicted O-methyltransferase YrrM
MPMLSLIKNTLRKLPLIKGLVSNRDSISPAVREITRERSELCSELAEIKAAFSQLKQKQGFVPAGHFYSPIPSFEAIKDDESRIFARVSREINGVDLNEAGQLELLKAFVDYYEDMPFEAEKREGLRFYYENPAYSYSDAILLHCMLRYLQPKRVIEIGSGFSSCMILDTNERFFNDSISSTFIEPYPELLMSLLKGQDRDKIRLIPARLQDVDPGEFEALRANDVLFIDSTHVSKIDSDVNRIFFEILPRLSAGVFVHFHDIFFPFEYPKEWVFEGRAWNEAYLLRAFLQFNRDFRVVLMNTYMNRYHRSFFEKYLPLCLKNTGGSIWICKDGS